MEKAEYARFRKLEDSNIQLRRELQQEQEKNKKLRAEISDFREAIKDMKPTKSGEKIIALKSKIADLERIIDILRDKIYELEHANQSSSDTSINDDLVMKITELKGKLSRKGTAGKPRNNNTTNQDVLQLRAEGKTIRQISQETRLSTATITKILKPQ